ncbi:aldose 1-epimerase [Pseudochrobactrum sp. HB0163]|uniref:aldose 1-epimerase n=1 Tax=Pseudochrobactrum sp. HB0163 TaxID=3450708 RepID=UPI003F6E426C
MSIITLKTQQLEAHIAGQGGTVHGLWWCNRRHRIPLLREAKHVDADPVETGGFPLIPFGNRIAQNFFSFEGCDYQFCANTQDDPLYIHGEGWQALWQIAEKLDDRLVLRLTHDKAGAAFIFDAEQRFTLDEAGFSLFMRVTNKGNKAMPFGLGWHPYFHLTEQTQLQLNAKTMWTQGAGYLPEKRVNIPDDLNFSSTKQLPGFWVNNGFEGWDGKAMIVWPEYNTTLIIKADPLFDRFFLYMPHGVPASQFRADYFCLEPMSHMAGDHGRDDYGGLKILQPGESLSGTICLQPEQTRAA